MAAVSKSRLMLRKVGKVALRGACAGGVAGAGAFAYLYHTDTGFERSVRFWRRAGPILAHYWWEKKVAADDEDREDRYRRLHALYAPVARQSIEDLRGMFVKVGQVLSVRPEAIPEEYRLEFRKLQDAAPPARWDAVQRTIEEELQAPISELFLEIDETPLGAASIGQAHLARLRSGRRVVLKVQYPEAPAMLHADFGCLEGLLWLLSKPDTQKLVGQLRQQFALELDYEQEAKHLRSLRSSLQEDRRFRDKIALPEPIEELCRDRVIGMEYLPGPKLEVALRQRLEALGVSVGDKPVSEWLLEKQRSQASGLQTDSAAGSSTEVAADGRPSAVRESTETTSGPLSWIGSHFASAALKLVGADRSMWLIQRAIDIRLRLTQAVGALLGRGSREAGPLVDSWELRQMLRLVLAAHGYQMFFCQYFNADPHPGNILLLPDGRVGLIDFGQCQQLTSEQREGLAKLFVALGGAADEPEAKRRVAGAFSATGVTTQKSNEEFLSLMPRLMFDKMQPEWLRRDGPIWKTMRKDKIETLPTHLMMAYRTSMLLRGLCLVLQENISIADEWRPLAEKWLHENGIEAST
eukprot:TRINITY_DN39615_c0_g1_i1.p1 TRINITY_DN39615_c0_g1~~TRINITY_DN39615_c0_g1_i1.p1  ORF type:complete len:581 (-),score=137.45 TRINITY_DN39615_c0_g1_i1:679-2421(-)